MCQISGLEISHFGMISHKLRLKIVHRRWILMLLLLCTYGTWSAELNSLANACSELFTKRVYRCGCLN